MLISTEVQWWKLGQTSAAIPTDLHKADTCRLDKTSSYQYPDQY